MTALRPASEFTLGSALAWLGHDCRCSGPFDDIQATVWFIRKPRRRLASTSRALVALDLLDRDEPIPDAHRLLAEVNACVAVNGIRVARRPPGDNGRALATVADHPASRARHDYITAVVKNDQTGTLRGHGTPSG